MLKVHTKKLENVTVLYLQGRIVRGDTAALCNAVNSEAGVRTIVLDFSRVSTVDAGSLGVMLELLRQAQSKGIDFKLMNVTKRVSRLLEISRLNSVFEVTSGVEILPVVSPGRPVLSLELARCALL
jgi:anti-anti-sigma factor